MPREEFEVPVADDFQLEVEEITRKEGAASSTGLAVLLVLAFIAAAVIFAVIAKVGFGFTADFINREADTAPVMMEGSADPDSVVGTWVLHGTASPEDGSITEGADPVPFPEGMEVVFNEDGTGAMSSDGVTAPFAWHKGESPLFEVEGEVVGDVGVLTAGFIHTHDGFAMVEWSRDGTPGSPIVVFHKAA